jgi:integrase
MAKRRPKGTGSIVKRSNGTYYFYWTDGTGMQRKKSLRTKNRKEAEELTEGYIVATHAKNKKQVLFQAAEANQIISSKNLPLEDIWTEFLKTKPTASKGTQGNYERMLKEFIAWCIIQRPSLTSFTQIDLDLAMSYMESIWESGVSANTYNYKRGALATITKALQNRFSIDSNLWLRTDRKKGVQQKRLPLNSKHVKKLLEAIDADNSLLPYPLETACLIKLCLFAGMRLYDAANIQWDNIDLENGYISYEPKKTKAISGVVAQVPIFPLLRQTLHGLEHSSAYVLEKVQQHYSHNPDYIKKALLAIIHNATGDKRNDTHAQTLCKRSLYGAHSLRHTFATEAAKAGVKSIHLSRMLGDTIRTIDKFYVDADLTKKPVPGFAETLTEPKQKQIAESEPERQQLKNLIDTLSLANIKLILKTAQNL